jgi:DNA-binding response OmpR family regulator
MLPRLDGFNVMKEIRQRGIQTPILLLTARIAVADKVTGLDLGADDYLTKPFAFEELLARVRALLRRGAAAAPAVLTAADLTLDPATRQVTRGGKRIDLTSKEYALLEFLLRRRDQVLSRAVIAQHVWGVDYDTFTNVIDVYVNYLRKKIDSGFEPKLIHTVRGFGYVLKEEAAGS